MSLSPSQHACLDAMGIDVWVPRTAAAVVAAVVDVGDIEPGAGGDAWAQLEVDVSICQACSLAKTRTQTVFGTGDRHARWMVIGEAPGADEDRQGEPFVGRAGQLLNAMLQAAGFQREDVYIANILKCRPPNNRDPQVDEVAACAQYLQRQIEWVNPQVILAVGQIAAQNLLQIDTPIGRMRGNRYTWGRNNIPVVVTYHPAYLLRSPTEKAKSWADLCLALSLSNENVA